MPTVFISYSRKNGDYANAFKESSERAGLSAFQDTRSMEPGEDFMRQTYRAMDRCHVFVLLWSAQALESKYVFLELNQAINSRKRIIPVRLDDTPLPGPISTIQALSVETPEGMPRVALEITRWLERRRRKRALLLVLGVLLAVIAIGTSVWAGKLKEKPAPIHDTAGKIACHKGRVLDHEGNAMVGIEVGLATRLSNVRDITDAHGEFSLCVDSTDLPHDPRITACHDGNVIQAAVKHGVRSSLTLRFPAPEHLKKPHPSPKKDSTKNPPSGVASPTPDSSEIQPPPRILTFKVQDKTGRPCHGAIVRLYKGGHVIPGWDSLITDKDGQVSIQLEGNTITPDEWEASYNGLPDRMPLNTRRNSPEMTLGLKP